MSGLFWRKMLHGYDKARPIKVARRKNEPRRGRLVDQCYSDSSDSEDEDKTEGDHQWNVFVHVSNFSITDAYFITPWLPKGDKASARDGKLISGPLKAGNCEFNSIYLCSRKHTRSSLNLDRSAKSPPSPRSKNYGTRTRTLRMKISVILTGSVKVLCQM